MSTSIRILLLLAFASASSYSMQAGLNKKYQRLYEDGFQFPLEEVIAIEDPTELNQQGAAMDVVGNYLFIGAPGDGEGRVDIYFRGSSGYFLQQRLEMPEFMESANSQFGRSIAGNGTLLIVGTEALSESGRVVLYRRNSDGLYMLENTLEPSNGMNNFDFFAENLAVLEDELIAVSSRGDLEVHLFEADPSGQFPSQSSRVLTQVTTGTAPNMNWETKFGSDVKIHRASSGVISVLVGMEDACFYQLTQEQAPDEVTPNTFGSTAARTGGVAVIQKTGGNWMIDHRLIPDWSKMKNHGFEINVKGKYVAVGALYSNVFSNNNDAGTASVYKWNGSEFSLVKTIWPSLPYHYGWFGYSVDICDDQLFVGQPYHWNGLQGLVEVFKITSNDLIPTDIIKASDGNAAPSSDTLGDSFGRQVVCNKHYEVIVSAPFSAPPGGGPPNYAGGAIYLFR